MVSRVRKLMSLLLMRFTGSSALLAAAALVACTEPNTPDATTPDAKATKTVTAGPIHYEISDGKSGGPAGFYFLPPIASSPKPFVGPLDASVLLTLQVKICALPACSNDIAVFTSTTNPAVVFNKKDGYSVNWDTKKNSLSTDTNYRLRVYANGALLGYADIDVFKDAKEEKLIGPDFVALKKDAKLNVKFRVETEFVYGTPPSAKADSFKVEVGQDLNGNVLSDNGSGLDSLGDPTATITSYGGGYLGGSVTDHAAGTPTLINGGSVRIDADGTIHIECFFDAGIYTFYYRLTNSAGTSDGTVTIYIPGAPMAHDDDIAAVVGTDPNVNLYGDNGHGADFRGVPVGSVKSYGEGDSGNLLEDNQPGEVVRLTNSDGGGVYVVIDEDGTFHIVCGGDPGVYTLRYKLGNDDWYTTGLITITLTAPAG